MHTHIYVDIACALILSPQELAKNTTKNIMRESGGGGKAPIVSSDIEREVVRMKKKGNRRQTIKEELAENKEDDGSQSS